MGIQTAAHSSTRSAEMGVCITTVHRGYKYDGNWCQRFRREFGGSCLQDKYERRRALILKKKKKKKKKTTGFMTFKRNDWP